MTWVLLAVSALLNVAAIMTSRRTKAMLRECERMTAACDGMLEAIRRNQWR